MVATLQAGNRARDGRATELRAAATRAPAYRADVDGLRAIAVLSVVLYHANIALVGGGYVGVDVFFVISGYLISRNISDEIAAGRFSFAAFYERRARRILPALFAVLLATTVVALLLMSPGELTLYAKTVLAATLGLGNMLFRSLAMGSGYFDDASDPSILLHTWSLGVEEQFYVLLPPILLGLRRLRAGRQWPWLLGLALASFAWSAWTLAYKPNYTFYVVFPRAWELLAGSLLALRPAGGVVHLPARVESRVREAVALAGLGAILFAVFAFTKATAFPGPAALLPVGGACALIWSGEGGRPTLAARLLTLKPMVFLGLISYSLYLWHWPIIVAERMLHPFGLTPGATAGVLVASLACATLSYSFVEQPFRRKRRLASRRAMFAGSAAAMTAVLAATVLVVATRGLPARFDPQTLAAIDVNEARAADAIPATCLNWRKPLATAGDLALCPIGDGGSKRIAFVGDSHVAQLRPVVAQLSREGVLGGRDVIFPVSAGCVLSTTMNLARGPAFCPTFMRMASEIVDDDRVDTVLIGFSAWFETDPGKVCLTDGENRCRRVLEPAEIAPRLAEGLAVIRASHLEALAGDFAADLHRSDFAATRRIVRDAVEAAGAVVYDPRASLCDGDGCTFAANGVSLYSDANHLAESQVGVFHDGLAAMFGRLYAPRLATVRSAKADDLP